MAKAPGDVVGRLDAEVVLPTGIGERFAGYGVMGLPFASGHVLALRRFPASSLGPGYTSVWHRDPAGNWVFYSDVDPYLSCSHFFGNALVSSARGAITLAWTDPRRLMIGVPEADLIWEMQLAATTATRVLSGIAAALPAPLWKRPMMLGVIARIAGRALGAGRLTLSGCAPNGQRFRTAPRRLWVIAESWAQIGGLDLGVPAPLTLQAQVGEFLIPQRGLFVMGSAFFEPSLEGSRAGRGSPCARPSERAIPCGPATD
jgi:hypothetical protein